MIKPPNLKQGDLVSVIAPARRVTREEMQSPIKILKSWGLEVVEGVNLYNRHNQFGGSDMERAHDLQEMINNPQVKAIFCARGGYGISRIVDQIDYKTLRSYPKWICGFSDITAMLMHLYALGIEGMHSTMPLLFDQKGGEQALESLRGLLFGKYSGVSTSVHEFNKTGKAFGPLIGGNLSILAHIVGSKSDANWDGAILFLEDLDEYLYNIDRMMVQLNRAGKLKRLAGLVVGQMSAMNDNDIPFGKSAYEIIQGHVSDYSYPVCFGFPVGHEPDNRALPIGRKVEMTVTENGAQVNFLD